MIFSSSPPSRMVLLLLALVVSADAFVPPAAAGNSAPLDFRNSDHLDEVIAPAVAVASVATVVSSRITPHSHPADVAVQTVKTLEEYELVVEKEKEKMVVVRFRAPWCKNCKATDVAYKRLARKSDLSSRIKFVDVDLDGSPASDIIKDHAAVSGVPFGLIYHGEVGLVDRLKLNFNNGMINRFMTKYQTVNDGWQSERQNGEGWSNKDGWIATKTGATFTLAFENVEKKIRTVSFYFLRSYGDKWKDSRAKFTVERVQKNPDGSTKTTTVVSEEEIAGVHANEDYKYSLTLSETLKLSETVLEGETLAIGVTVVSGSHFKIMGMMLCNK